MHARNYAHPVTGPESGESIRRVSRHHTSCDDKAIKSTILRLRSESKIIIVAVYVFDEAYYGVTIINRHAYTPIIIAVKNRAAPFKNLFLSAKIIKIYAKQDFCTKM